MIPMYNHPTSEFATGVGQMSSDGTVYQGVESTFGTAIGCVHGGVVYSTPSRLAGTELGHVDSRGNIYSTRDSERPENRVGRVGENGRVYDSPFDTVVSMYGTTVVQPFGHVGAGTAGEMRAAGAALLLLLNPERVQVKANTVPDTTPAAPAPNPEPAGSTSSEMSPLDALLFPISLVLTFGSLFLLVGNLISRDFAGTVIELVSNIPAIISVLIGLVTVATFVQMATGGVFKKVPAKEAPKAIAMGALAGFVCCLALQVVIWLGMGVIGLGSRGANATGFPDAAFLVAAVLGALLAMKASSK